MTPVRQRIADIARATPAEPALIGFDPSLAAQTLSWSELADQVNHRVDTLTAIAERRNPPCVAVPAANTMAAAVDIIAVLAAELPLFPLNPTAPPPERAGLLAHLNDWFDRVYLLDTEQPRLAAPSAGRPAQSGRPPAYLLATGGSSGRPKIAAHPGPLGHDPARTPSLAIRQTGWRSGQRQLIVGPLYHAAPFTTFLDALLDRNTIVLQSAFNPQWTVDLIAEYGIEWLQLTPTHMREILRLPYLDPTRLRTVRGVLHTAAHCDPATKRGWIDLLGGQRLFELYGATEEVGVTLVRGDEWLARPGTVGRGVLTQIAIMDGKGRRLPPGEVGTVYMRTARRSDRADYLGGRPVRTTVDGFRTVGDLGRLDRDGYLYLEPRQHDVINVGGEKVDPGEVEAVALDHPKVQDAVAVGIPHESLGFVVGLHVLLRPATTMTRGELVAHCGRRLANYKVPKRVAFVDHVPRSASGKVQRWRLSEADKGGVS